MSSNEPIAIRDLTDHVAVTELDRFEVEIGMGALVGSLPSSDGEWAYHTNLRSEFSPLLPGIELASSIVIPLRKTQATFKDTILLGRASSNDICLEHPSISKLHARFRRVDGRVVISDAGSKNGTVVDGAIITEEVPLAQGASVDLGDSSFVFYEPRVLYDALLELHRASPI